MKYFYYGSKFKIKKKKWRGVVGGVSGCEADEQTKTNLPLQLLRGMDRGTVPNQFAHSTSSKLGHNNALMYKLMSMTTSIYFV